VGRKQESQNGVALGMCCGQALLVTHFACLQVEAAVAEANAYALASHVFWGLWALLQARYSVIEFDYVQYSKDRWVEYHRRKSAVQELVAQAFT
jgi:hypothetical protein